jgi:hypothetical protein
VPEAHIEPVSDCEIRRPKPPLADTNKLRMILGASASVALILAARYLDRARIPMVSLAFAIIGGPAAEQILSHRTDKDRQLVKQQLTRVVTECDADYLRAVTGKLKVAYADSLRTLRACRDQWRAAELESLVSVTATEAPPGSQHWDGILRDARALVNQLGGHTP